MVKRQKKRLVHLSAILVAGLMSIIPLSLEMAPERFFQISDSTGKALPAVTVRRFWHQYAIDRHGDTIMQTDSKGHVRLPRVVIRTSVAEIVKGAVTQIRRLGIHASIGSFESIGIFTDGYEDQWFHNGGAPKAGSIVLADKKSRLKTAG